MRTTKPASYGADRLFARLDLPATQYYPAVTQVQARSLKEKYWTHRLQHNGIIGQVKALLNGEGVSHVFYTAYIAFAMAGLRILSVSHGEAAAVEFAGLISTWVARGLSGTVLARIRLEVFNVSAPVGP